MDWGTQISNNTHISGWIIMIRKREFLDSILNRDGSQKNHQHVRCDVFNVPITNISEGICWFPNTLISWPRSRFSIAVAIRGCDNDLLDPWNLEVYSWENHRPFPWLCEITKGCVYIYYICIQLYMQEILELYLTKHVKHGFLSEKRWICQHKYWLCPLSSGFFV
jgi:hypothetical protein